MVTSAGPTPRLDIRALFEVVYQDSPISVAVYDTDGRLIDANDASCRMFGVASVEDLVGYRLFDDPDLLEEHREKLEQGVAVRYATEVDFSKYRGPLDINTHIRGTRYFEVQITPLDPALHDSLGYLVQIVDVTEAEQNKRARAHDDKLAVLGRLAAGVAHDFNNLLTVIHTELSLALDDTADDAPVRTSLEIIEEAAQGATALSRQLLGFVRGQMHAPRVCDLNEEVRSAGALVRRLLPESIRLSITHPDHPVWVRLDPNQLQQIALNIAANARDAMGATGELRIEVASGEGEAQALFADDGAGMAPDVLARASESFFTTKSANRGTGLGLALVAELTERNGGRLDLRSEEGVGTTVRLAFPLEAPAAVSAPKSAPSRPAVLSTTAALIIDDEPSVRRALIRILEHAGASVVGISGRDDLGRLPPGFDPTVVVLDMILSGGLGSALVPELVARFPRARVLMMTGYAPGEAVGSDLPRPVERILTKPITRDALLDALTSDQR